MSKKRGWLVGGIIAGVVLLVALVCCAAGGLTWYAYDQGKLDDLLDRQPSTSPSPTAEPAYEHAVRYEVDGSGAALITWAKARGGTDSEQVQLPWSQEITINRKAFGVMVLAFPRGEGSEVTGCRIFVDGVEQSSVGAAGGVVACSAAHQG